MKKLPKKLFIFGQETPVIIRPNLSFETGNAGYYDPIKREIVLCSTLKGEDLGQTLIHEFLHGVSFRTGLIQTKIPMEVFEVIAETSATALVENFKFSPR